MHDPDDTANRDQRDRDELEQPDSGAGYGNHGGEDADAAGDQATPPSDGGADGA